MNFTAMKTGLKCGFEAFKFGLRKNGPHIALGLGIIGVGAGFVYGCVQSFKVPEEMAESKKELEAIKNRPITEEYTEQMQSHDKFICGLRTFGKLGKIYAVPVLVTTLSLGAIIFAHRVMVGRLSTVSAALVATTNKFNEYRQNVKDQLGAEQDYKFMNNLVETTVLDENGTEVTKLEQTKKPVELPGPLIIMDRDDQLYNKDPETWVRNVLFAQRICNEKLRTRALYSKTKTGWLTMNEALDILQLPRYKSKINDDWGWIYHAPKDGTKPISDFNVIDLGVRRETTAYTPMFDAFMEGLEDTLCLNPNVNGPIRSLLTDEDYQF